MPPFLRNPMCHDMYYIIMTDSWVDCLEAINNKRIIVWSCDQQWLSCVTFSSPDHPALREWWERTWRVYNSFEYYFSPYLHVIKWRNDNLYHYDVRPPHPSLVLLRTICPHRHDAQTQMKFYPEEERENSRETQNVTMQNETRASLVSSLSYHFGAVYLIPTSLSVPHPVLHPKMCFSSRHLINILIKLSSSIFSNNCSRIRKYLSDREIPKSVGECHHPIGSFLIWNIITWENFLGLLSFYPHLYCLLWKAT